MKKNIILLGILIFVGALLFVATKKAKVEEPLSVPEVVVSTATTSVPTNTDTVPQNSTKTTKPAITTSTQVKETPPVVSNNGAMPELKTFTLSAVATHKTEADCYSAINGVVYDLTAWINKHPGGDKNILRICGIDGSSAYNREHGGDKKANNILAGFEVGVLVK